MHELLKKTTAFAEGLDHPECVAIHIDGSVWAGGEGGQIYRIEPEGSVVTEVANTGGFILGIAFSPGCEWLCICDSANHCLWKLDLATRQISELSTGVEGHRFSIPNYPVFDREGNLYVSESGAFRSTLGKIIRYDKQGAGKIWHPGPFSFANGMSLDKTGAWLYVVISWLPGVERIRINADGSAGEKQTWCLMPQTVPDGIAFDEADNLYITCYAPNAIYKLSPDREMTLLIDDWEAHTLSNPTNIAFGGKNFDQLFTSNLGRWHVNRIDLGVKGLPLASHYKG